ncbi:hypothetical protein LIER_19346 [Lithospermum erythrorhizon]|uniref:Uncharacterized protein n=1 Tax=Lithospermum erythrorhizon TaxID=34254 RepID=A0AAV3QIX2_LITER
MAVSLTRLSWLLWGRKEKEQVSNGGLNSVPDWGYGIKEPDNLRIKSITSPKMTSPSTRKVKKKWKSREERKNRIDREYDMVLVPSDGVCLSGSESDDSDWSVGWLEPHAPDFQTDDEETDSFAVLVPCYRHECSMEEEGEGNNIFLSAMRSLPNDCSSEGKKYIEQWLSSLQNF